MVVKVAVVGLAVGILVLIVVAVVRGRRVEGLVVGRRQLEGDLVGLFVGRRLLEGDAVGLVELVEVAGRVGVVVVGALRERVPGRGMRVVVRGLHLCAYGTYRKPNRCSFMWTVEVSMKNSTGFINT